MGLSFAAHLSSLVSFARLFQLSHFLSLQQTNNSKCETYGEFKIATHDRQYKKGKLCEKRKGKSKKKNNNEEEHAPLSRSLYVSLSLSFASSQQFYVLHRTYRLAHNRELKAPQTQRSIFKHRLLVGRPNKIILIFR